MYFRTLWQLRLQLNWLTRTQVLRTLLNVVYNKHAWCWSYNKCGTTLNRFLIPIYITNGSLCRLLLSSTSNSLINWRFLNITTFLKIFFYLLFFYDISIVFFYSQMVALRLPLQDNRIVAWKFCHVTHKLLREGHPACLDDSQRHITMIENLAKLWVLSYFCFSIWLYDFFIIYDKDFVQWYRKFYSILTIEHIVHS